MGVFRAILGQRVFSLTFFFRILYIVHEPLRLFVDTSLREEASDVERLVRSSARDNFELLHDVLLAEAFSVFHGRVAEEEDLNGRDLVQDPFL